ncbi:MAG: DNA-binding protein, partial [Candidatus Heimdallarchaeota archaeon]|nr:DNA-binding protein [Candidatus Heimdallarchaeota archaeon]
MYKMSDLRNTTLHIGFDDTDSLKGSCTTYLAVKIIEKIHKKVVFLDYPRLIRNNPNIPWKTRGNGAIALSIGVKENDLEIIKNTILNQLEN